MPRARPRPDQNRQRLLNSIIAAGENQRGTLRSIRDSDPAVGAYLQGLEERLEALARILSRENHLAPDTPTHDVNISGNGIRFRHDEKLVKGTHVELGLQLCPSHTALNVIGKVVRVKEIDHPARAGASSWRSTTRASTTTTGNS